MANDKTDGNFPNPLNKILRDNPDSASANSSIRSIPTLDTDYNTDHPNIGIAIIFNHTYINGQEDRVGTDTDKKRIKAALELLGFKVRIYDDKTFYEINDILTKAGRENHSNNDCLVVVVMSHGSTGKIYANDMPYSVESLWKPFLGENCESLRNKPKLFFIQACRGDKLDVPVQYKDSHFKPMCRDVHDAVPQKATYFIPNTADLLIMYSTFEGHYSWRNTVNGSWFIESLSDVLEDAVKTGKELELIHLLTAVNRKVAYEYQSHNEEIKKFDEMKEMPNYVSTLTKTFKFKIKK